MFPENVILHSFQELVFSSKNLDLNSTVFLVLFLFMFFFQREYFIYHSELNLLQLFLLNVVKKYIIFIF